MRERRMGDALLDRFGRVTSRAGRLVSYGSINLLSNVRDRRPWPMQEREF